MPTQDQIERFKALDEARLEGTGDPWKHAWAAVDLARELEGGMERTGPPTAANLGLACMALSIAEASEGRLATEGRTSADDNGTTAPQHVRNCLGRMALDAVLAEQEAR